MKLLKVFLSFFLVLLLISLLSYGMAPQNEGFQWSLLNPMEALEGIVFLFSFGFGFPIWLSIVVVILTILAIWYGFYQLLSKLFAKRFNL